MKTKLLLMFMFLTITLQAQTNLVPNGNFENWTSSSQPNNWFRFFNGLVFQSTSAQNGSSSTKMQITSGTFNYINSEFFPVVAGKTYRITLYHKLVTGTFSAIDLRLYHKPGTFKTEITKKTDAITSSTEWRKIEFDYTPTVSESIEVDIWTTGTLNSEILVDNVSVVDMATLGPQYTLIPDLNFEKKLIALGHDSGIPDGKVLTSKIAAVTSLNVSSSNISDLTGIEDFVALKDLRCSSNKLTLLNLTKNLLLESLNCDFNQINTIDISKNTSLNNLSCRINKITTIDLSKNTLLKTIDLYDNLLAVLNLTTNAALINLNCSSNKLTSIDVTNNLNLSVLNLNRNLLSSLNISKNTLLTKLDVEYNNIQTLDVRENIQLTDIFCTANRLKSIDVTLNTKLQYLNCGNNGGSNSYTSLDLSKNTKLEQLNIRNVNLSNIDLTSNILLKYLDCSSNTLTAIDLSQNKELKSLLCNNNKITKLDLSDNKLLVHVICSNNQILQLDVSKNNAIQLLQCQNNKLTRLNLKNNSNNVLLSSVTVSYKTVSDNFVGLPYNTSFSNNFDLKCITVDNLEYSNINWATKKDATAFYSSYDCSAVTQIPDNKFEEKLIALGIDTDGKNGLVLNSSIESITTLNVENSSIIDLKGIESFEALSTLNCSGNQLNKLDLSKNTTIATLNCSNNPSLTCIQVADIAAAEKWNTTKDTAATFSLDCTKYTLIPDAKFEDKLIALGIDRDGKNGKVKTESISEITNLNVTSSSITNLTGIQDFVSLKTLYCNGNGLTSLDITKNIALTTLECKANQLTTLDVSKNLALTTLNCNSNKIGNLDVSKNVALTELVCYSNQLSAIDISKNIVLSSLDCSSNLLTTINVSFNTALKWLSCSSNQLTSIDVTKNSALFSLSCGSNKLTAIDVTKNIALTNLDFFNNTVSTLDITKNTLLADLNCASNKLTGLNLTNSTALKVLFCSNNQMTNLDLSKNLALEWFVVNSNQLTTLDLSKNSGLKLFACNTNLLTSLNLKNGKNTLLPTNSINLVGNPNLKCVLVDDETYSNANWSTKKDATASFNATDCTPHTLIPDGRFEDRLIVLGIDTDGKNGKVKTASIELLTNLSIMNAGIKDLSGIQDFKSLKTLLCSSNELTAIDLSENTALTELYCDNNLITTLDVSKNINLSYLACFDNQIAVLDVSKNVLLKTLSVRNNKIASLDLSKNVLIETLICKDNVLTSLNLKNGKNTLLSVLDTRNNSALSCILVDDVEYATANFRQKDVTSDYSLNCTATVAYTTIPDVKFEEKLIALGIDNDGKNGKVKTTSIEYLKSINLQFSEIKDLTGIEDFKNLEVLDCAINSLTQLNVTKNLKLTEFYCHFNTITSLDVSKNLLLTIIQANKNRLQNFDVSTNKVLKKLNLRDNQLTTLNLKNGYNANASYYISRGNPNLTCIQVDSKTYADANWSSSKDTAASYSDSCTNLSTGDIAFEKLSMYPNPTNGALFFDNVAIDSIRVYDALGKLMNVPFTSTSNSSTANLEQLPTGIYYIYLTSNDATTVKKVMVQ